jgi:hypothetical protein
VFQNDLWYKLPPAVAAVTFAGTVIVGSIVSTTVTAVAVLLFPAPSVVQVTVVFPNRKVVGALFATRLPNNYLLLGSKY